MQAAAASPRSGLRATALQPAARAPAESSSVIQLRPPAAAAPDPDSARTLAASLREAAQEADRLPAVGGIFKRMFDISGALLGLLMVWPLMLAIAVATRLTDPGPVFYSQSRIGRGGRPFACWKFRTMAVDSHLWFTHYLEMNPEAACEWAEHAKLRDDPRVTRIGRFLRRSSLDELPQLFNILMGDMSFVGPRPVIADELVRYGTGARAYLRTRPGLTGLWQVSGRNDVPYRRRIAMDRRYVARWSMLLDFAILLRTARVVVRGTGY